MASAALRGAGTLLRQSRSAPAKPPKPPKAPAPSTTAAPPKKAAHGSDGALDAIVYAPHRDGDADPGEVVWAWIPYEEDHAQGKDRPAIAIGYDGPLLVVVPLTSKDQDGREDTFALGTGPWDPAGRPSWVKLDRLIGVQPGAVRREGAALDRARFDQVVARIKTIHGAQLRLTQ
ncbi:MAG: hypothetical protein JWN61_131 [Pseudonocardiales bacterium]|nr:hypothetical protein [Pseudonocardiales bacterium]